MAYSNKVIEHYEHPRNVGSLPKEDPNVGTGLVGAPECGDVMKLQVKVNPATGVIDDCQVQDVWLRIRHRELRASPPSGSRARRSTKRLPIKNTEIVAELALPPVKIHCSVLAEDAIKAAIADYKKKQGKDAAVTATETPPRVNA